MKLDKATVARIAMLARIEVPDADLEPLSAELSGILGWIEQLGEVDTRAVEPMRSVMPLPQRWRVDAVTDGGRAPDILRNAPRAYEGYFAVPKVVE